MDASAGSLPKNIDIICFSQRPWESALPRPRNVMTRWAQDRRVFYFEEPSYEQARRDSIALRICDSGIVAARPRIRDDIFDTITAEKELLETFLVDKAVDHFLLWYLTPMLLPATSHLNADLVIYDCIDEDSGFPDPATPLKERERELFRRADLVLTGPTCPELLQGRNAHSFPAGEVPFEIAWAKISELVASAWEKRRNRRGARQPALATAT